MLLPPKPVVVLLLLLPRVELEYGERYEVLVAEGVLDDADGLEEVRAEER